MNNEDNNEGIGSNQETAGREASSPGHENESNRQDGLQGERPRRAPNSPRAPQRYRQGQAQGLRDPKDEGRKRNFRPSFKTDSEDTAPGAPRKWVGENKQANRNREEGESRHADGTRRPSSNRRGNLAFHRDLKKGVEANTRIQKGSLNANHKLNLQTNAKVRITPLGGLGEIGGNMTVIETETCALVIDIGMSFPDSSAPGVDILIPNFHYINDIKHKIAAVLITHAHEDHIGAVPYFYKKFQFPLYGTPLALGLVGSKFDEHGLKKCKELFHIVEKRRPITIGEFEVEWIHTTHSIIDSSALALRTEAGVVIHTGDFKIDHTPIDNLPTDLHRLAHYGEEGVLLLLSDSTNSHKSGVTPSEASVGPTFDNLFRSASGRVIMSTFSSNIHRVYQAIQYGLKYGRKIAVIGRSMEKNLEISRELGYVDLPSRVFIEANEVVNYPDEEVLIVTTGSQGESMSALYRMASDEHKHIKIQPSDLVILSAKAIPGNESSVSSVINLIMKAGARVAYQDFNEIHVSGHASQEEQKLMLRLVKPKFFLPVHGEFNHIAKHKQTALACGVPEKNIYLMEDGDQIEVNPNYLRKVRSVRTGKTCVDNQANRIIDDEVVNERSMLSSEGMFVLTLQVNKEKQKILEHRINMYGIVGSREEKELAGFVMDSINTHLAGAKPGLFKQSKTLEENLFSFLRKLLFKRFKKNPGILVNVLFEGGSKKGASSSAPTQKIDRIEKVEEAEKQVEAVFNDNGDFNNLA